MVAAAAAKTAAIIMAAIAVVGCAAEGDIDPAAGESEYEMSMTEQKQIHEAWRVDMVTANNSDMLTEYSYDEQGRLLKKRVADIIVESYRTITRNWEDRYEWEQERVVKKTTHTRYHDSYFGYDDESTSETMFEYDDRGRPMYNERFVYDEQGRLVQTYSYEFGGLVYADELVWDERGNVVRHISSVPESNDFEEPVAGTRRVYTAEYEYDNHPKPNFGLGDLFSWGNGLDPWPYVENTDLPRTLSRNNLTRAKSAGYEYRYTYNAQGLPATVQTIWIGIETDRPMGQTIIYKRVNE